MKLLIIILSIIIIIGILIIAGLLYCQHIIDNLF